MDDTLAFILGLVTGVTIGVLIALILSREPQGVFIERDNEGRIIAIYAVPKVSR